MIFILLWTIKLYCSNWQYFPSTDALSVIHKRSYMFTPQTFVVSSIKVNDDRYDALKLLGRQNMQPPNDSIKVYGVSSLD